MPEKVKWLSAHQPAYLPWLGYFEKISRSDVFVYLDEVQFEKNSFSNRNKIKTSQGELWLTIPVNSKGHTEKMISEIEISNQAWIKKHLSSIEQNYRKARFFKELFPQLEVLYGQEYRFLSELCLAQLLFWLNYLQIKTEVILQSTLGTEEKKSALVLELCLKNQATHYYSGALGRDYLHLEDFVANDIQVEFQQYQPKKYEQLHGEFSSHLGVVDFCMNCNDLSLL